MAFSSRERRPFFRAIWANSTSWSMYSMGLFFLASSMILKCLGISFSMCAGKLAATTVKVQPMVIKILAASKKFQRFSGVNVKVSNPAAAASGPMLIPRTMPSSITINVPTTPIMYVIFMVGSHSSCRTRSGSVFI